MNLDLKISLAKSYLVLLSARAKGNIQKQIDNCYYQLLFLEDFRAKSIKMLNAKNELLIHKEKTERELKFELSKLRTELQQKELELQKKNKQIETLKTDIEIDFTAALDNWRL